MPDTDRLVGSTSFAHAVRAVALAAGVPAEHPILTSPTFGRRVVALLVNGQIASERIRNRMYADPAHAHRAAVLLGLLEQAEPASLAA